MTGEQIVIMATSYLFGMLYGISPLREVMKNEIAADIIGWILTSAVCFSVCYAFVKVNT